MTKYNIAMVAVAAVIVCYLLILLRPTGPSEQSFQLHIKLNLMRLSASGLDADGIRKAVQSMRWQGRYNAYEVHVETGTDHSWTLTAQPVRKTVVPPVWRQILRFESWRAEYPTFRIRAGTKGVETLE